MAVPSWPVRRINGRRDAALLELFDKVAEMGRADGGRHHQGRTALVAFKDAIEDLHDKAA
ncbi:MAG: hypothetical protein IPG96_16685 [Proteobacteria bacterium]|nr:hypothetical protein [Pseudomonadota bacterium]